MSKKATTPTPAPVQGTLELPYAPVTSAGIIPSRAQFREKALAGYGRQSTYIPIDIIEIRAGYNVRIQPEGMSDEDWEIELGIPEFAQYDLLVNGMATPIEGDLLIDGDKLTFFITTGERRTRAIRWLVRNGYDTQKNGKAMNMVEVYVNPRETTELDRISRLFTSDNNLKYNPIELGHAFLRLKTYFNYTHDAIRLQYNFSRQTVDNYVKLALEPKSIQNAILRKKLAPTVAIELINTEKDPAKREEIVAGSLTSGEKLKVKDISEANKYKDFHSLFGNIVLQFNDEIITHSGALIQAEELAIKVKNVLPAEKEEIERVKKNIIEVLNNNNAINQAEKNSKPPADTTYKLTDGGTAPWDALNTLILNNFERDLTNHRSAYDALCECKADNIALQAFPSPENKAINTAHTEACKELERLKNKKEKSTEFFKKGEAPWIAEFNAILKKYKDGEITFEEAGKEIEVCEQTNWERSNNDDIYEDAAHAHTELSELLLLSKKTTAPTTLGIKTDTNSALDAEEESRRTSDTQETYRPKNQKDDALQPIDFKKDKELGEMELNEAIGLLDKLVTKINLFPDNLKQYKNDCTGLAEIARRKIETAREIIKKASDVR